MSALLIREDSFSTITLVQCDLGPPRRPLTSPKVLREGDELLQPKKHLVRLIEYKENAIHDRFLQLDQM